MNVLVFILAATGAIVWSFLGTCALGWGFCHFVAKIQLRRQARLTGAGRQ